MPFAGNGQPSGSGRFGPLSSTNGWIMTFGAASSAFVDLSRFNANGAATLVDSWYYGPAGYAWRYSRPIGNSLNGLYVVREGVLVKRDASFATIWSRGVGIYAWTLAEDKFGGVHLGVDGGGLMRYDSDGNQVWTNNFGSVCNSLVLAPAGNRFISLDNGVVARLGDEASFTPSAPVLRVSGPGDGLTPQGFRFTLVSQPNTVWQIFGTTNLSSWTSLGTVTNLSGEVQFTDPGATGKNASFYKAAQ